MLRREEWAVLGAPSAGRDAFRCERWGIRAVGITCCAAPSAAVEGVGCGWKVATSVPKLMGTVALA